MSAQKIKYRHATLAVSLLESNSGQIEGLPRNPRLIKDNKFKALQKSVGNILQTLSTQTNQSATETIRQ